MPYLHCSGCRRITWLMAPAERTCSDCSSELIPLHGDSRLLTRTLRDRFEHDAQLDAGRPRFVRDSGSHRIAE